MTAPSNLEQALASRREGRMADAERFCLAALSEKPGFAPVIYLLGELLWARGAYDEACDRFGQAIPAADKFAQDYLANQIQRLNQCDWHGYESSRALTTRLVRTGGAVVNPVNFMYISDSASDQSLCARLTAYRKYPAARPLWTRRSRRPGKIRLGYLSSDFYDHAVAHVIAGVFEHHDRNAFELTAISCCPEWQSPIRNQITGAFDHFLNVMDLDDMTVARLIFDRDIDVLISLSGYAYRARPQILAHRPAPVQVSFLGFPGSLGAPYVDYLIADQIVLPPEERRFYAEKIAWMPHVYQPTDDRNFRGPAVSDRQSEGLPADGVVLMAYNQLCKVSPGMFAAWMRILHRSPRAVLWLSEGGDAARINLRQAARDSGIDPARLIFAPRIASREAHLARHHLADLFIDTLPYNAHSTASDALWFGLPVVTCRGGAFPGRVCASLVTAAGFPELAVDGLDDYENLIVDLAGDPARLAALRQQVERRAPESPLFQTENYTRHLESAYRTMYEASQSGLAPESFAVKAS